MTILLTTPISVKPDSSGVNRLSYKEYGSLASGVRVFLANYLAYFSDRGQPRYSPSYYSRFDNTYVYFDEANLVVTNTWNTSVDVSVTILSKRQIIFDQSNNNGTLMYSHKITTEPEAPKLLEKV